jgi:hypothetical protein
MPTAVRFQNMRPSFLTAIANISTWGDTDVFPLSFEGHVLHDGPDAIADVLQDIHDNFDVQLAGNGPVNESTLALVGYTGFRWATQLDPIWNAYLLALVLSIGEHIEAARLPATRRTVFSYRYLPDPSTHRLFADGAWQDFKDRSLELAESSEFVLTCDVADFYARIYHHRLENSLNLLGIVDNTPSRIMRLLGSFSGTASYGLPVGGPAARLLSELLLNRTDRLLVADGIAFVRFADDYHVFAPTRAAAYDALRHISEVLLRNEGLTLQKGKTRIMTRAEFRGSSLFEDRVLPEATPYRAFLAISLRFDPYSPTRIADYEALRAEVERFDITGMLARELQKSRVNPALTRRLLQSLRFLSPSSRDSAVLSLLDNLDVLAPLIPQVFRTIRDVFPELADSAKTEISERLLRLIRDGHYLLRIELNLSYALRVIALRRSDDAETLLASLYDSQVANFVKRDIVLIMAQWRAAYWISDKKHQFGRVHPWIKRALLVSSYILGDEGRHWRRAIKPGLPKFELAILEWAKARAAGTGWVPPV